MQYLHFHQLILGVMISVEIPLVVGKDYYGTKGSNITLVCTYKAKNGMKLQWSYINPDLSTTTYSQNDKINSELNVSNRLSVTGNYNNGEYNLQIHDIRESDEGNYKCLIQGIIGEDNQTLSLMAPPLSATLQDVTIDNKILGTEGQSLTLRCSAIGGKPPPLVTVTVDNIVNSSYQTVELTIPTLQRRHHRQMITCKANNSALNSPLDDTATLYLYLKPLQPIFSPNPVTTNETKPLVVSCVSNGSRPAATFQWTIGAANATSNSTAQSTVNPADDTYIVTSTLTYSVNRTYNGTTVKCGAYNNVSISVIEASAALDVKYAPNITVTNKTYDQDNVNRTVTCNPNGNPSLYTYNIWKHISKYGELVRELVGGQNGVLTLPSVPVENRYQDSGEYVCNASNGITGRDGKANQIGSGFVTVNAQPVLISGNKDTEYGEIKKDKNIDVYIYSVPKYTSKNWYKSNKTISQDYKYKLSEADAIVTSTFYGTKVQLDGYRITLTIKNLEESDFNISYAVEVSNGVGQPVRLTILLVSASAPQTPINFTLLNPTESSILVQWEAGYNGGHEQSFYIKYHVYGSNIWEFRNISDSMQKGLQTFRLSGLQDDTMYEVRMYAGNKFNNSLSTETVKIKTTKADSQASKQIGPIVGGVGGALAAVLIVIVVICLMIFKRKKDTSTPSKASRSDSDVPDGLQHNILYQSAGSDFKPLVPKAESGKKTQKPSTSETEYAEVQKPNAVYAAVDKTAQQKNVQDKKQKDKKKRPKKPGKKVDKGGNNNQDGEYANDGMSLKDMGEEQYANSEDRIVPITSHKNQQGLEYADLSFTKQIPQKGKKPIIHGVEDRTLYSEVDHTKKAPPPPQESAYEETNFKHG